ncbi:cytochrome b pre-mRNA-processing protein 3 [Paragonimus westermani]|uniref:Cytochrome b pre-mRNA-processing protein 3 n=1 Tax=Paragonimus westermani TaxID=34504 RepID=A0A5J4ND69_9TREM|nr:cytochrome b pre-mRNA-processing protein 3 [Paragonimus westermani]
MLATFLSRGFLNQVPVTVLHRSLKQVKPNVVVPTLLERTKFKLGLGDLRCSVTRLNAAGENMFAVCAEYPVFEEFVEHLALPDTFQSWFSITTVHMWMCLVRLRQEGVEGQLLKKTFVNLFWLDLRSRMRTFKILRKQHNQVSAFRMQFFGAMFAYDEGFLSHSDALLVSALWRNLFLSSQTTTAQQLELALEYVRKNLAHLDSIRSDTIIRFGTPTFLPLLENQMNPQFANERLRYCLSWPVFAR